MERVVIHLGLHKTGTSAVQDYLKANSGALLQRGAAYIPLGRMREEVTGLFYRADDAKRAAVRQLVDSFPTGSLILSDENIAGEHDDVPAGAFYSTARDNLMSVLPAFAGQQVHLVLTLRDPAELLPSRYSEYLRHFDFVSFDAYISHYDVTRTSHWETFGWTRELPENVMTHIVPFEQRFGGGVPLVAATIVRAAVGTSVGFDFRTLFENKVRTSFTAEEIELAALVAARTNGRIARLLLANIEKNDARFGHTRYLPIEKATTALLSQRYEQDLAKFGIALPPN